MATQEPVTESLLVLGKSDDGRSTTVEEFAEAFFEEPWIYERVDGCLVVMLPEGKGHVIQGVQWHQRLNVYAFDHPEIIQAVVSQAWMTIGDKNTRIADLGVYLGGNLEDLDIPNQIPDLVFEFVSQTKKDRRRDYVEKRADYQKVGVREYVIVDRFDRKVTVLTLGPEGYQEQILIESDLYRSPLLPGFQVVLAEVLPR
jgi:Uma2 family endonuclease